MPTINLMKCACPSCLCVISTEDALEKEGKYYCSKACAEGHKTEEGCAQAACNC
ncbi:MAG: metallothionein [Cyanobacteria bacterium P01_A01_bin.45]